MSALPARRVAAIDWPGVRDELDAEGHAIVKSLLTPHECAGVAALYIRDEVFRSRVVISRHGSGDEDDV